MNSYTRNKVSELHAEIRELRRELARIPSRTPAITPASVVEIQISSTGNNMALAYAGLRGLYYDTSETPLSPSSPLASAYNPDAQVAITDKGVAYGTATIGGSTVNVLIVNRHINDASGTRIFAAVSSGDFPAGDMVFAWRQIAVPAPSSTFISAYQLYWS